MNDDSVLDLIVENKDVNSELDVKAKSNEISKMEGIIFEILKKISPKNELKKLQKELEKVFLEMNILIEDSNKISFKHGMRDSYKIQEKLERSVEERTKVCDLINKYKSPKNNNDDILSLIFEERITKIAELTEEDRIAMESELNIIDIDGTFAHLSKKDKDKIKEIIELIKENDSLEISYLCEKYWRDGVKCAKTIINI